MNRITGSISFSKTTASNGFHAENFVIKLGSQWDYNFRFCFFKIYVTLQIFSRKKEEGKNWIVINYIIFRLILPYGIFFDATGRLFFRVLNEGIVRAVEKIWTGYWGIRADISLEKRAGLESRTRFFTKLKKNIILLSTYVCTCIFTQQITTW